MIKCHLKSLACNFYFSHLHEDKYFNKYSHNNLGNSFVWCKQFVWMGTVDSLSSFSFFSWEVILLLFALIMICGRDIDEESSMYCYRAFCFICLKSSKLLHSSIHFSFWLVIRELWHVNLIWDKIDILHWGILIYLLFLDMLTVYSISLQVKGNINEILFLAGRKNRRWSSGK